MITGFSSLSGLIPQTGPSEQDRQSKQLPGAPSWPGGPPAAACYKCPPSRSARSTPRLPLHSVKSVTQCTVYCRRAVLWRKRRRRWELVVTLIIQLFRQWMRRSMCSPPPAPPLAPPLLPRSANLLLSTMCRARIMLSSSLTSPPGWTAVVWKTCHLQSSAIIGEPVSRYCASLLTASDSCDVTQRPPNIPATSCP